MKNEFYSDFDFERLSPSKRVDDYRSPFQIDRDRIIHSSEFRRLQGKTQVFLPGEYDFYRTRLTHSLEVSQIGRSICNYLLKKEDSLLGENYFIDPDLVESACLAHDIGHPPFGHAGERTLNTLMKDYGGFEGNAQTLRLITELLYTNNKRRRGMNPSRAFLDSILKYKQSYSEFQNPENHFIYDYQKDLLNFNFRGQTNPIEIREELNSFRSIECQIMDWADDTAYAINDIVDSISIGFLSIGSVAKWKEENANRFMPEQLNYLDEIMQWIKSGTFKSRFGSQIGDFILGCNLETRDTFMDDVTNRYKYRLSINKEINDRIDLYKCISIELVFNSPQLHQLEFKGNSMLSDIFNVLTENYLEKEKPVKLLPDLSHHLIKIESDKEEKVRLICDYISGMTDSYAVKTYRRLFDPGFSSILELS